MPSERAHHGMPRASWTTAFALYLLTTFAYVACAWGRLGGATPANHFALQAEAWLHGQHALLGDPQAYVHGNDFALFDGKIYMSFPPLPAMAMLPGVWLSGSAAAFRDGLFVVMLAGLAPALLFLALERLRLDGRGAARLGHNAWLAIGHGLGSVYFFSAVQGTVWFAGHVFGSILLCAFLWAAQRARHPWLCGVLAGALFLARPTMLLATSLFASELWLRRATPHERRALRCGALAARARALVRPFLRDGAVVALLQFAAPLALWLGGASLLNHARFGDLRPHAFGHEHLTVVWQTRIQKWGLFHWHYLPKNLGVATSSLPWPRAPGAAADEPLFRVNEHGLALWFTTPLYLLLFWPRRRSALGVALWLAVLGPCAMNLFYQNSGWRQFGYRFSNDYAPLLFALLAVQGVRQRRLFHALLAWSIGVNLFGALSFDRAKFSRFYFRERTQAVVYQPD